MVEMKNITKTFPGIVANQNVDFYVAKGEVHALLGENGAGKTTLMNILAGFYKQDQGQIILNGKEVVITNPRVALKYGIGMVHQHFRLIQKFSVTENIIVGWHKPKFFLSTKRMEREIVHCMEKYNIQVDPKTLVWQLSVGDQQKTEILKMLYRGVDLLILDEPTAVLTPQESEQLFKNLKIMTSEGCSVILISHKLNEVMQVADRITVMRGGQVVTSSIPCCNTNVKELTSYMIGDQILKYLNKSTHKKNKEILRLEKISANSNKNLPALKKVSLSINECEILGIAGVSGNGQSELAEVIYGLRTVKDGSIIFSGKNITNTATKKIIEFGISCIPEDKMEMGLAPNMDVFENTILKHHRNSPIKKSLFLNRNEINNLTNKIIQNYNIKVGNKNLPVKLLSGGNLQKLIIGRELHLNPKLVIAFYPTRGLDIQAVMFTHKELLDNRTKGIATLLISEDLDELILLSDNIAVLYNGEIMGIISASTAKKETIGLMMMGQSIQDIEIDKLKDVSE